MHFGRFDVAVLQHYLGITVSPVKCTKIAAKLVRTFTDRHGLKDLCKELLGVELSKQQQSSDWGADGADVGAARLCRVRCAVSARAVGEAGGGADPREPAGIWPRPVLRFLPTRGRLDLLGYEQPDIFAH